MKKLTGLLTGVFLMFAAGSAMALPVPPSLPFTIGNITFSDFAAFLSPPTGLVTPALDLSGITLTPVILGGNPGFQISGSFSAQTFSPYVSISYIDLLLKYKATSSLGLISDVGLSFNGGIIHNPAFASVTETVYSDSGLLHEIGQAIVSASSLLSTEISLSEDVGTVYVTKDILLSAFYINGVGNGEVAISDINQTFSRTTPVPEPGTMMLLGAGLLSLAIYTKRRKNT